jgi:hypothetical protein
MTNTLHRSGNYENLGNDFIVFALPCRGYNTEGSVEKLRLFLRMAVKHRPVNLGDGSNGSIYQPSKHLKPTAHWTREESLHWEEVIEGLKSPGTVAAVFDNEPAVVHFLEELRQVDLGISINVSGLVDRACECAQQAGITRHSVEYSLGFMDQHNRLADRQTLELATMCGHGMISPAFAAKMVEMVKENRRTPEQATRTLARFCTCGIFNPTRSEQLLEKAKLGG